METQLKSLIEKYCLNSNLTDNQLDEIIDLALETKANPKEVEEYIQKTDAERKAKKEEVERKAKEEEERRAKEEAERKAKEETERKAKEETERKANEERVKQNVKEFAIAAKEKPTQLFNDVFSEEGVDHDAVIVFKKRLRLEAMEAYKHRNDSPEAAEYNRILWEEYDKVVKTIQSGRVETMDDLKRIMNF
jgi:membrane protein involved in colicin uptake